MKVEDFKNMIREIIREEFAKMTDNDTEQEKTCEGEGCLEEKSVPQPYNRKSPPRRPMTKSQIAKRKKIGNAMMRDEKIKSKFMKKHGDEWKDYLWAAASSATFREKGSTKGDDKRKR